MGTLTKTCPMCKRCLPLSEFAKNRSKPMGIDGYCRVCTNDYNRIRRAAKREQIDHEQ